MDDEGGRIGGVMQPMFDSRTTATPEIRNATPTDHPPARVNHREILQGRGSANEAEVEQGALTGQQVMRAIGGGSPSAPPEQFAKALGGVPGRSQPGLWRQIQHSYGNHYVEQVIQRKCADCDQKDKEIQRQGDGDLSTVPEEFEAARQCSGTGQPLDAGTRSFMESRFGQDFSDVRVHTDSGAIEAAKQIQAQAFTTGRDIYFGRGRFQPQATEGQKLLAHELAHTLQQDTLSSTQTKGKFSSPNDPLEQAADDMAAKVVSDNIPDNIRDNVSQIKMTSSSLTTPEIQRQLDPLSSRSESYKALEPGQPQPSGGGPGFGMNFNGSCKLRNGTMNYSLLPRVGYVNARIEFVPTATVAAASRTISFIQTVVTSNTSGGFLGLFSHTSYSKTEVDALPSDTDPFYGAKWNRVTGKWGDESTSTQVKGQEGSHPFTASIGSAVINDSPMLNINESKQFETVAVVVETGAVLGSLSWNIQRWKAGFFGNDSSTLVRRADCAEGTAPDFQTVVETFYSGNGNVIIDGFAAGSADLPTTHRQKLAPIVDQLRQAPNRRVILGGAATQDEANPSALSRLRVDRVRAYLVSEGVNDTRIEVESYGADWARVPITSPAAADANRRVQIRIK
jgi:outer membrane protein OmpA-like peptidoglycan-associated protein